MYLPTEYKHTCAGARSKAPIGRSPPQPPKSGFGFLAYALDSLQSLPSVAAALDAISASRRNGRPGYPPAAMFRAFSLKYLLGERFTVAFIERLRSSARLREICGFADAVPSDSTFSRFFSRLAGVDNLAERAIPEMVERVKERLPDVGQDVAVDSTDIRAYAHPTREDTDATWGYRTTKTRSKSTRDTEPFFGYKLHSITDTIHGVPLAHIILPANESDTRQLRPLIDKARGLYSWLRPKHLFADRGYDSQANHKLLIKRGIIPIIHLRRPSNTKLHDDLYDFLGRPVCADGKTPMEYLGTHPKTGLHKFRCPPSGCALKARSRGGAVRYCDTTELWLDPADNYRALGIVYRDSPEWRRLYKRRQVIERMFGSLKRSRLLDRHQYVRRDKVEFHLGLATLTYLATMLARVDAGDAKRLRRMRIRVRGGGVAMLKNQVPRYPN